jgi:hypothetical protein
MFVSIKKFIQAVSILMKFRLIAFGYKRRVVLFQVFFPVIPDAVVHGHQENAFGGSFNIDFLPFEPVRLRQAYGLASPVGEKFCRIHFDLSIVAIGIYHLEYTN